MSNESNIRDEFHDQYRVSHAGWMNAWQEMQADLEFYLLCQHSQEDADLAERQGRRLLTFDKTARQVNLISGYEERNRHILKIAPVGMEDDIPSTQHTKIIMQQLGGGRGMLGYDVMSKAFKLGCLASGSNLVELYRDRFGHFVLGRRGYNSFLLDPLFTNPDLSDCGFILTGQWLHEDQVKSVIPTNGDTIDDINTIESSPRWPHMGQPLYRAESKVRLYEEYWRRKSDYVETVVDHATGEEIPFKTYAGKMKKDYNLDRKASRDWLTDMRTPNGGPAATIYSKPVTKILLTVFVDDKMVYDGDNPLGLDDYNFVWFHGDFVPECPRDELKIQSYVRGRRDPQTAYSRKMNQCLDIIESQIQTGKIFRAKYIKNYEDLYKAGQGVHFHVKDNWPPNLPLADVMTNVVSRDIQPGLFQLMEGLEKSLLEGGGLNEEILGSDDKDIAGILHKFRTGAALTGLQGLFSGFRGSKRQLGIKLVRLNQIHLDARKVYRMINEMPAPGFYKLGFSHYDCTPVEGTGLTDTQMQMNYMELRQLRSEYPDAAQLIPLSYLIKKSGMQVDAQFIKMLEQSEQQMKAQAQQASQQQQRLDSLVEAQTAAQVARANEDISDVQENRADIALKQAQTMVQIQKLQGENQRAPGVEMRDTVIELLKLMLEKEKIQLQRKPVESKTK